MQLSLIPEDEPRFFLDLYARVVFDSRRNRFRLRTIDNQRVPGNIAVRCPSRIFCHFPEGTIYKLDARLVQTSGKLPYLVAVRQRNIQRALEFFDHNVQLQKAPILEIRKAKSRRKVKA
ncbi:MAG: hypothetical protein J7576_13045 [Siphonobacter aquaeclarae]|nr:hypothetical protein [Siphonobacter aquaeclarae]